MPASGIGLAAIAIALAAPPAAIEVTLQSRDPVAGAARTAKESIDPSKTALVAVDMWNFHWRKTSAARVAALVPRMEKCVEGARSLGMQVFWCPTDVADNYAGTPAFEEAAAVQRVPVPEGPA